jgi:hypothetical protein
VPEIDKSDAVRDGRSSVVIGQFGLQSLDGNVSVPAEPAGGPLGDQLLGVDQFPVPVPTYV